MSDAEPMTDSPPCDCHTLAQDPVWFMFWTHHSNCPAYRRNDEMRVIRGIIDELLIGIESWAADEDGVHYDCWHPHKRACDAVGRPVAHEEA